MASNLETCFAEYSLQLQFGCQVVAFLPVYLGRTIINVVGVCQRLHVGVFGGPGSYPPCMEIPAIRPRERVVEEGKRSIRCEDGML